MRIEGMTRMKIKIHNILAHAKKIMVHRRWVRRHCFKAGLCWQGFTHDLSKYSPVEFWESVKYFQGTSSPIIACKKDKGYSMGWFHHRGRNRHHWEYWVDDLDEGMIPKLMPEKYAVEMFCDFLAAGKAYMGESYSREAEFDWWKQKRKKYVMHPAVMDFIDTCFANYMAFGENYALDKDRLHRVYQACKEGNNEEK